jgi:hypothetical protein
VSLRSPARITWRASPAPPSAAVAHTRNVSPRPPAG